MTATPAVNSIQNETNKNNKPQMLDEDKLAYYDRMDSLLNDLSENDPDNNFDIVKQSLIDQIILDRISIVTATLTTSRIAERTVKQYSSTIDISNILIALKNEDMMEICCHKYGSHFIETLIEKINYWLYENANNNTLMQNELNDLINNIIDSLMPIFIDKSVDFAFNPYATFIIRSILQMLSGILLNQEKSELNKKIRLINNLNRVYDYNNNFKKYFKRITKTFYKSTFLLNSFQNESALPTLTLLFEVIKIREPKCCFKLFSTIMQLIQVNNLFKIYILDEKASFLIQTLISVCHETEICALFDTYIEGSVYEYATHPIANYAIQTLLQNIYSENIFERILSQIEKLEDLLAVGHFGVVHIITTTAHKFPQLQKLVKGMLFEAFHCTDQPYMLIPLLLVMVARESAEKLGLVLENSIKIENSVTQINYHGSLITQALIDFAKPKFYIKSLFSLGEDSLVSIATDVNGSHVIDKMLTSQNISLKYMRKIQTLFENRLTDLLTNKHGSRVFDKLWACSDEGTRNRLIVLLADNEALLKYDCYGKFVLRNCQLNLFKRKRTQWEAYFRYTSQNRSLNLNQKRKNATVEQKAEDEKTIKRKCREENEIDELFNKLI